MCSSEKRNKVEKSYLVLTIWSQKMLSDVIIILALVSIAPVRLQSQFLMMQMPLKTSDIGTF